MGRARAWLRTPVGRGFAGRVASERRPVVLPEVTPEVVVNPLMFEKGVRSLLGVPMIVERRLIGVLHVGMRQPRAFTDADAQLLQLVADRTALAIDHARLFRAERQARLASEAEVRRMTAEIDAQIDAAFEYARSSPFPAALLAEGAAR